jgi:hypothetical protein
MRKLTKEEKPTYVLSYSGWVRWGRIGLVVLLAGAALVTWALAWVNFVRPLTQGATLAMVPLRPLISAHLGLLFSAGAVALVYTLLPDLSIVDGGLAVRTLTGWLVIPWAQVTAVRIASFELSASRLVLIQGKWGRRALWSRLVSPILGAGWEQGILLASAIRDFKPLVTRAYQEIRYAAPEAVFDDDFFSLPARLVAEPVPTCESLAEQAREDGWPLGLSAQAMGAVAGGLLLVLALMLILSGGAWWKPLAIVGLAAAEWLIGTLYLYAISEFFPANVEIREARLLYPLPQIPRALLAVPMAMFVAAGAPFLAAMLGLAGVLWAVILTGVLVQKLFKLESILPALAGGSLQALYQFVSIAIIFAG